MNIEWEQIPATTLATTAAITAVTTMNKTIQAKSESMGAKSILNSLGEKSLSSSYKWDSWLRISCRNIDSYHIKQKTVKKSRK